MPAAVAACTPLGASSTTRHSSGGTPSRWAAAAKQSGAGFPLSTCAHVSVIPSVPTVIKLTRFCCRFSANHTSRLQMAVCADCVRGRPFASCSAGACCVIVVHEQPCVSLYRLSTQQALPWLTRLATVPQGSQPATSLQNGRRPAVFSQAHTGALQRASKQAADRTKGAPRRRTARSGRRPRAPGGPPSWRRTWRAACWWPCRSAPRGRAGAAAAVPRRAAAARGSTCRPVIRY